MNTKPFVTYAIKLIQHLRSLTLRDITILSLHLHFTNFKVNFVKTRGPSWNVNFRDNSHFFKNASSR